MDASQIPLAAVAGIVLSLLFSYVPALAPWYDNLTPIPKRLVMLAALLITTAGLLAYKCRVDQACYSGNLETYVSAFIAALVANQAADRISPALARQPGPGGFG